MLLKHLPRASWVPPLLITFHHIARSSCASPYNHLATGKTQDSTLLVPDLQEGLQPLPTVSWKLWHSQASFEAMALCCDEHFLQWTASSTGCVMCWFLWNGLIWVQVSAKGSSSHHWCSFHVSCHCTIFWAQRWGSRHEGTRSLILRGGSYSLAGLQHFCSQTQDIWGSPVWEEAQLFLGAQKNIWFRPF